MNSRSCSISIWALLACFLRPEDEFKDRVDAAMKGHGFRQLPNPVLVARRRCHVDGCQASTLEDEHLCEQHWLSCNAITRDLILRWRRPGQDRSGKYLAFYSNALSLALTMLSDGKSRVEAAPLAGKSQNNNDENGGA